MIVCMHCQGWPLPHTNTHSIVQDYGTGWSWGTQQVLSHWVKWMTSVWVSNVYVCVTTLLPITTVTPAHPTFFWAPAYISAYWEERESVCVWGQVVCGEVGYLGDIDRTCEKIGWHVAYQWCVYLGNIGKLNAYTMTETYIPVVTIPTLIYHEQFRCHSSIHMLHLATGSTRSCQPRPQTVQFWATLGSPLQISQPPLQPS